MAKKPKETNKKISDTEIASNPFPNSNPSSIFKSLFGDVREEGSTIFSDDNPFRRKPNASSETPPNQRKELLSAVGFEASVGKSSDLGLENDGYEFSELKKKKKEEEKRNKDKRGYTDSEEEENRKVDKKFKGAENRRITSETELGVGKVPTLGAEAEVQKDDSEVNSGRKATKGNRYLGSEIGVSLSLVEGYREEGRGKERERKKKRKRHEVESEYEAKRFGTVDKNELEGEGQLQGVVVGGKRKKMDNPEELMVTKEGFDDENKLLRTVFVGNLPLKIKKKVLLKEFSKFGEVESVRIRSVPIIDSKRPRKGAVIKKQFNENANSVHAYIVFKTEDSAQASLEHNMAVVGGNHIRVDRACPPRKKLKGVTTSLYDNKRTIFVGNLPFDVKDEEIYQLFSSIKQLELTVEAVRVVRDPNTSLGKGIAYVLFKTQDSANLAVRRHNLKLRDRELRLSHSQANSTPSKRKISPTAFANKTPQKKMAIQSGTPSSKSQKKAKATISYQGLQASKSGAKNRSHTATPESVNFKSAGQSVQKPKERLTKRPAVAARKANALRKAAALSNQSGRKRKFEKQTPNSSGRNKKARRNR